jgi:indole-3-glycerol phosphate synthase
VSDSQSQHLKRIYDRKREELAALMADASLEEIRALARDSEPPRDFLRALAPMHTDVHLIAELKKASPSKGMIRPDFDPAALAKEYADSGASAISVLTEQHFFLGDPGYLALAKGEANVPVLRKDFLFDPWQIHESRALGADAILLIAAMLDADQIARLSELAGELGMASLIEIHDSDELKLVPEDARLVGVNNRNLHTFVTDLDTSRNLIPLVKEHGSSDRITVSESGILDRQDVLDMRQAGADAILVGEALMRRESVGQCVREFLGIGG